MRFANAVVPLLAASACGWISSSQSRYGASIVDIAAQTYGQSTSNAYRSLGWLWVSPSAAFDGRGLGGSISWAMDPALCDTLLPHVREEVWAVSFVTCADVANAMSRAFAAWSVNHPLLSFTDVSTLCAGYAPPASTDAWSCPHAEIVITMRTNTTGGPTSGPAAADFEDDVARATPRARITNLFRYSNGESAIMNVNGLRLAKQTIETYGGRIEIGSARARLERAHVDTEGEHRAFQGVALSHTFVLSSCARAASSTTR